MAKDRTLLEALSRRAAAEPERTAYHYEGVPRSFGELWRDAGGFAGELGRLGLQSGDRVLVVAPNGRGFFTAFYGTQLAGGVPVPLFPGSGAERLVAMARRCGARWVATGQPAGPRDPDPLSARLGEVGLSLVVPDPAASPPSELPGLEAEPEALAYLQYTSGSTGEPKGVEIRHGALLENIRQMIAGMAIGPSDRFVSWLPVHHDMGLVLMTMVPLYLGLPLFLLPTSLRNPGRWLGEITRRRATFTAAPDFAYRVCLRRAPEAGRYDLTCLRVAVNAAEPVRQRTLADFEAVFGLRDVMMPAYGLAEATVGVSMCAPGRRVRVDRRGFVSVGRPFPGVEVGILAGGRLAEPGEIGEIVVKSPANTRGYWRDAKGTEELFWGDGFLRTGDLGYLDRGELFVVGRKKNLIIQAGRNLAPREIEEAIDVLPFVRASAAVAIDRGGEAGEQAYAFVELRKLPRDPAGAYPGMVIEVVEAIRSHQGIRPGRVYLMRPAGIPRTSNGKVRYQALRQAYLDGSLRSGGTLLFPDY